MSEDIRIVGIAGSLREGSYNRALIRAATELTPDGVRVSPFDLRGVPMYEASLDGDEKPEPVQALKDAISEADGVLIATPEYNYGVPGVLKNAIDWASRPGYRSPFRDKPVAIVSASPSALGGVRAQQHLKLTLLGMASAVFPWPEYVLAQASERVQDGALKDARSREMLGELLEGFAGWIRAVRTYGANAK